MMPEQDRGTPQAGPGGERPGGGGGSGQGHQPQMKGEPKPPFPEQHLDKPGLESGLEPRPQSRAPRYQAAGRLQGRAALITGGDSGIGRAVAVLYAREGADVAIVYLPAEQRDAEETRRAVEAEGEGVLIPGDLTDPSFCREAVERAVRELGKLDLLVSNAAHQNRKHNLAEVTEEEWDRTFQTNIYAYFRLAKAALPHLKPGSAIIATSSETGLMGSKLLPDYSATKGAINAFTKVCAEPGGEGHPRQRCGARAGVDAAEPRRHRGAGRAGAQFGQQVPYGRPAQPEEVAPAYVFLASDADASYITGEVVSLLGGKTTAG